MRYVEAFVEMPLMKTNPTTSRVSHNATAKCQPAFVEESGMRKTGLATGNTSYIETFRMRSPNNRPSDVETFRMRPPENATAKCRPLPEDRLHEMAAQENRGHPGLPAQPEKGPGPG